MNHWLVHFVTMVMTIFALFGDDFRLAFFTKEWDLTFYNLTLVCLIGFTLEITLNCLCQSNYFNSFYFYLFSRLQVRLLQFYHYACCSSLFI